MTQKDFDTGGRRLVGHARSLVMGILNVTPDSFSDGGRFNEVEQAVAQALRMAEEGADIIDIGAESTRPGHEPVSAATEIARLSPVLEALRGRINCPISVDTMKAPVAEAALRLGATIINDVWAFSRDPRLAPLAAEQGVAIVLMHNRETIDPTIDIVEDMLRFLDQALKRALDAGVPREKITLDPGIGFGKTLEQNLEALISIAKLKELGCAVLVGASRKSMIGKIIPSETDERLPGTIALHTAAILKGADVIRVHDVKEAVQAARVADRLRGL